MNDFSMMNRIGTGPLFALFRVLALAIYVEAAERPNLLFIAIDDLRPELGCYGSEIAVTPHLDSLANRGLLFNRAYCQQAICRPSRASLMTGTRPETTGLFHNYVSLRELQPDILTLPQYLVAHGYETSYYSMSAVFQDIEFGSRFPELAEDHPRRVRSKELFSQLFGLRAKLREMGPCEEHWSGFREVYFPPTTTKSVRISFLSRNAFIDELEIFGNKYGYQNLALASAGTIA